MLASVLKPVSDTRMFEKLGQSLALLLQADVHIIGFPSETPYVQGVTFHKIFSKPFRRISLKRLIAPVKIFFMFLRLRPESIIVSTHELLIPGALYKCIKRGVRLYYDVQENYYFNIRFTSAFPQLLRAPLAAYVRMKERLVSPAVNHFLLAEKGYVDELKFIRHYTVLENKLVKQTEAAENQKNRLHLLFTGTLAETTGAVQAVELALELHRHDNQVRLTIIGHAPDEKFLKKLRQRTDEHPFIQLRAEPFPVPHKVILEAIAWAGTGIIIYPHNPSTRTSIPTKLYEYLGMKLPVIIRHNEASHEFVQQCRGGIVLPDNPDYQLLLEELRALQPPLCAEWLYWESEVPKLLQIFNS